MTEKHAFDKMMITCRPIVCCLSSQDQSQSERCAAPKKKLQNSSQYTHERCVEVDGHLERKPEGSGVSVCVHAYVSDNVYVSVCSAVCMLHYTT